MKLIFVCFWIVLWQLRWRCTRAAPETVELFPLPVIESNKFNQTQLLLQDFQTKDVTIATKVIAVDKGRARFNGRQRKKPNKKNQKKNENQTKNGKQKPTKTKKKPPGDKGKKRRKGSGKLKKSKKRTQTTTRPPRDKTTRKFFMNFRRRRTTVASVTRNFTIFNPPTKPRRLEKTVLVRMEERFRPGNMNLRQIKLRKQLNDK